MKLAVNFVEKVADLKARIVRMEMLLEEIGNDETSKAGQAAAAVPLFPSPALSLNTPSGLPSSSPEAFRKEPPRFDILFQPRADVFADTSKTDIFFLRRAEVGVKGHIAPNVDFSLEADFARPHDILRRTYIRLTHVPWLHLKLGMEKTPIGLDELNSTAEIPFVDRSGVSDRFSTAEDIGVHLESRWPRRLLQVSVSNGVPRAVRRDE